VSAISAITDASFTVDRPDPDKSLASLASLASVQLPEMARVKVMEPGGGTS
jgi:hypothetical protein